MLHVRELVFLPYADRNFNMGRPVYWILMKHDALVGGKFLCAPVTEDAGLGDESVFNSFIQEVGHVTVHFAQAKWLHEFRELAHHNSVAKMGKDEFRSMLEKFDREGPFVEPGGEYALFYSDMREHAMLVSGDAIIDFYSIN